MLKQKELHCFESKCRPAKKPSCDSNESNLSPPVTSCYPQQRETTAQQALEFFTVAPLIDQDISLLKSKEIKKDQSARMPNHLAAELKSLGIQLNATIKKLAASLSLEAALTVISAVHDAMSKRQILNPASYLCRCLKQSIEAVSALSFGAETVKSEILSNPISCTSFSLLEAITTPQ